MYKFNVCQLESLVPLTVIASLCIKRSTKLIMQIEYQWYDV
jgi:hypothetical protein